MFCCLTFIKVSLMISFSGDSYRMETSQMVCDGGLLTGFLWFFWLLLKAVFAGLLLLFFVHHLLQNQDEIALKEMIVLSVSIVAASIYTYCVTVE